MIFDMYGEKLIIMPNSTYIGTVLSKINLAFIARIFIEVVLYFIFLFVVKKLIEIFFNKIVSKISDHEIKRQYSTIKFLCASVINTVVTLFFATNVLGALGIDMKPILATAGVLGVAIGFGGKRFVEDIISGLSILLTGQIRVGDYVTVGDSTGTVEKVNLAMIKIRAYNGDVHFVRNGLVDKVINHTRDYSNPIVEVPVSYNADIEYVMGVLRDLSKEIKNKPEFSKYILTEPEIVGIDSFGESSIVIKVRFKTTAMQQWLVHRYFRIMVKKKFDELNIEIPFNQLDVYFKEKQS